MNKFGDFVKNKTTHEGSFVTKDVNLQVLLYIVLALFPFRHGIPLWRQFLKTKDSDYVHPQFLINYVIQPVNTICALAEVQIWTDNFPNANSCNSISKKIKGYLRTLVTMEYLKFFLAVVDEVGNEKWADEEIKQRFMNSLQPTPDRETYPYSKRDFKAHMHNSVDSLMKLTMLHYPTYMFQLIEKDSEYLCC